MSILDSLLAEHAVLLQKIIDQAKKEGSQLNVTPTTTLLDLGTQINNTFDALIKDKKDKNIISGYVDPLKWTRNVNCWARPLDLTGTCVGIWGLGGVGGGTLITKKHVLLSNHVPYPSLPATIYFVDNNNNTYTHTIIKTKRVGNTDILIGELDREVGSSLKVYSVLPTDYRKYFNALPFPVLYSDQEKKALIGDSGTTETFNNETCFMITPPTNSNRLQYFESLMVGDSGNPVYTIVNNELVLLGGWYKTWYNNSGLSTNIPNYISDINNTISSLSVGYKLTEVNLSGFKTY